jgi:hypothetical protein
MSSAVLILIMQTVFDQVRLESPLVTSKRLYAKDKFQRRFSRLSARSGYSLAKKNPARDDSRLKTVSEEPNG